MVQYISEWWPDADLAGWTGPGWYFWDETQANCIGPFTTEWQARFARYDYARSL